MSSPDPDRTALRADCAQCVGLCCVVPGFSASADFAISKAPGTPCRHLRGDFGCGIHDRLRPKGFSGCTVYDCFGAGQKVAQVTFGGADWRDGRDVAEQMFAAFPVMRRLHELLWYLSDAMALPTSADLHGDLAMAYDETERLSRLAADQLVRLDPTDHARAVNALLDQASRLARAGTRHPDLDHRGADLIGRNRRGVDWSGAMLRGALLIGADLRGADLSRADLIGADLRGADLRGADLTGSIFLIQSQLDAAIGDVATRIDDTLRRPAHWSSSPDGSVRRTTPLGSVSSVPRSASPRRRTDPTARRRRG
ncbi:MAG TPA: pentapeptide repeat-containing protein [Micromonosporaceae bacterium]|nr:pentapeptide repeat-containing protein [Micromonosporaceae bacterium]